MGRMELEWDYSYLVQYGLSSAVLTVLVFRLVSPAVSSRFFPAYNRLGERMKAEWNDKFSNFKIQAVPVTNVDDFDLGYIYWDTLVVANINAVITGGMSLSILILEDGMHDDPIWYDSKATRRCMAVVVGFSCTDIFIMLRWCQKKNEVLISMILHHLSGVVAGYFISVRGILCYFAMLRTLSEIPFLFLRQRWFMEILGYKRTSGMYLLNGIIFFMTYSVFNCYVLPLSWMVTWQWTGTEEVRMLGAVGMILLYVPTTVLDVMYTCWFVRISQGFARLLDDFKRGHEEPYLE